MVVLKILLIAVGAVVYLMAGVAGDIFLHSIEKDEPNALDTFLILFWPVALVSVALYWLGQIWADLVLKAIRKFTERR